MEMAKASYSDESMENKFSGFVERSRLISEVDKRSRFWGGVASTDTEAHVCQEKDGTAVFVFRGTERPACDDMKSFLRDTATDGCMVLRPVKLYDGSRMAQPPAYDGARWERPAWVSRTEIQAHQGFQLALRDVTATSLRKENLQTVFEDMTGIKARQVQKVVCVGHSLGGGIATMCAMWCREIAFPHAHITCVTLGSPRVGNREFARYFNTRVANKSYRIVNLKDPVPCFPHQFAGYKHVDGAIYLTRDQMGHIVCQWGCIRPTKLRPTLWDFIACAYRGMADHKASNYVNSFRQLLHDQW
ncbi:hypothetical protein GOP47_0002182 [Adiantum capillus-veneris]|uniref:Fungal lipase-type domain-containing protein n=1 Tax=Adiantum capillus-veneris TaxID=13818 RepID=A0A9D4V9W0_ADICA|nr:hypothetical protein GOP47_0002182 [Adiantum capillus-veneris]